MKNHQGFQLLLFSILTLGFLSASLVSPYEAYASHNLFFSFKWGSECNLTNPIPSGCVDPDGAGPLEVGDGQFDFPQYVAVDASGDVYVSEQQPGGDRIQKFANNGAFTLKWAISGIPVGIAFDSTGAVYVVDTLDGVVRKFDNTGLPITTFGSFGSGDGQFNNPSGIAIDSDDNIYVVDSFNHRIQKFNSSHTFLGWAGKCTGGTNCDVPNKRSNGFTCTAGTCSGLGDGSGDGQFNFPVHMTVNSSGDIYVTEFFNHRVQKFDSSGNFLLKWGSVGEAANNPSGDSVLQFPFGITTDHSGDVYVADSNNHRIVKYDSDGVFIGWAGRCSGGPNCDAGVSKGFTCSAATCLGPFSGPFLDGGFWNPRGVAFDASGKLYIADSTNHRIQVFRPIPSCASDPLAAAGISISDVPPDTMDDLIAACSANDLVEIPPNSVLKKNVSLSAGEVLVVEAGAVINGTISGDGSNTVILGDNSQVIGNIKKIEQLFIGGTNVFIDGNYNISVKELIIGPGADARITGNVAVDKLVIEDGGSLRIDGNLTVRQMLSLGPNTFLYVGGSVACNPGTTVTKDTSATVDIVGQTQCSGL